jgi:hypothetical protein
MRAFGLLIVLLLAWPGSAAAQEPILPIISSPLAPIGFPLPSPGPTGRDPWIMSPPRDPWIMTRVPAKAIPPRLDDNHRRNRRDVSPVYVYVPQYVTVVQTVQTPPPIVVNVGTPADQPGAPPAPRDPEPAVYSPPPKQSTLYFIPGCYMGNVPPEHMKLPAGCDLSRLVTSRPQ